MMQGQELQLPWTQPGWLEQASQWIHAELERQGIRVTGLIEQPHVRPWSTVLRVPSTEGPLYFKATSPVLAHEAALTQALSRWRPDCMPRVLAADVDRAWMLLLDFGASLRSIIKAERSIRHWHTVLPLYAGLQIELSSRTGELLSLGVLDRRLAVLPALYDQMLTDMATLRVGLPKGLTLDEYRQLHELRPRFAAMCEQLANFHIPETLHHDDFHDGNIFVREGRFIFSDWAESCVSHPFFTLVVTLRSVEYTLELKEGGPERTQLRDVYLDAWTRDASREHLLAAFTLAQRVAMVNRALTWHRVVSNLPAAFKEQYMESVPGWLQDFLVAVGEEQAA
jgi:hypothetical protein